MTIDQQAQDLNDAIKSTNSNVFNCLSEKGKAIFFPKKGILSQSAQAKGLNINATIGTALEEDGTPIALDSIRTNLKLDSKASFSYAPSPGLPAIREKWREMMLEKNPSLKDKAFSHPVVTCALTHGLSMAGYLFVDIGDEILSPDLYWENYDLIFKNTYGGVIKTFPMFDSNGGFNIEALKDQLLNSPVGKKIVVLNFPNNPTGYTVTNEEAIQIKDLLINSAEKGNSLVVLIDDAYFGLVYKDGIIKESIFTLLCNAHERIIAVKLDGPTKEDYVWGFRVGFVTFGTKGNSPSLYSALEAKLGGAIRGTISNSSNISQALLLNAYQSQEYAQEKLQKYATLKSRYTKITEILDNHPEYENYFKALSYNSGYFMCVRVISGDAEAIRQLLIQKYDTGLIAQGDVLRIAFSSVPLEKLELLYDNLYKAAQEAGTSS